jgi:hypothetical protein
METELNLKKNLLCNEDRSLACIEKVLNELANWSKRFCPILYKLFTSSPAKYKKTKALLCYFVGTIYGLFVYKMVVSQMQLSREYKLIFGVTLILFLSIGMAFYVQMRCIITMSMINFLSVSGRIVATGFVFGLLLSPDGPISISIRNSNEVLKSILCFHSIIYNITEDNNKIKWKPYQNLIVGVIKNQNLLSIQASQLSRIFDTLENEFKAIDINLVLGTNRTKPKAYNDSTDASGFENFFKQVNSIRCEDVMASGEDVALLV